MSTQPVVFGTSEIARNLIRWDLVMKSHLIRFLGNVIVPQSQITSCHRLSPRLRCACREEYS